MEVLRGDKHPETPEGRKALRDLLNKQMSQRGMSNLVRPSRWQLTKSKKGKYELFCSNR